MKLIQKIIQISRTLLIPCCLLTSCNYLDVIPPAQADFDDWASYIFQSPARRPF